jgi:hypothetical protein
MEVTVPIDVRAVCRKAAWRAISSYRSSGHTHDTGIETYISDTYYNLLAPLVEALQFAMENGGLQRETYLEIRVTLAEFEKAARGDLDKALNRTAEFYKAGKGDTDVD